MLASPSTTSPEMARMPAISWPICSVALRARAAGAAGVIDGVIVGRALYDGRVDPAEALRVLAV